MLLPLSTHRATSSQTQNAGARTNTQGAVSDSPRTLQGKMARQVLILVVVVYVLLAVAYSLGTPPWEAPDEPSHYLYAEYLATHGSLPPEAPPQRGNFWENEYLLSLYEWYQFPLYYALVAPQISLVNLVSPGTIPQTFPPVATTFPEGGPNLFAVLAKDSSTSPYAAPGLRLARLFSVMLGLGSLLVVYRVALLASAGDQVVALMAAGFVAQRSPP